MFDAQTSVDVDEISGVIAFYRSAADVVGGTASDLRGHDLGAWAVGEDYHDLGERYREMGRIISGRLDEQARAADRLAGALHQAMTALVLADQEIADGATGDRFAGRGDR
ncbi:hypothetical protein GIY30_16940 [Gordonia sp. HNM0687]|uniref:ESX-1 secretion-associated protein n=1 Tax=Gordonia mangrovi TaxID=2665643 RepID=A0A6L7GSX7_9ACTN|nr:hypothetical protein [Gordonia mangrovi]MDY6807661.1 hypothetical protein [Actinomycetota bacterium]MXP23026.1 hypothetical protein [Gordonia mangrovi]UVF77315.1 hypothetical protein NWF22_18755 [Gordonia mangrovi]